MLKLQLQCSLHTQSIALQYKNKHKVFILAKYGTPTQGIIHQKNTETKNSLNEVSSLVELVTQLEKPPSILSSVFHLLLALIEAPYFVHA